MSIKLHERQRACVSGLPLFQDDRSVTEEIQDIFAPYGEVKIVSQIFEREDGRGYCFVEFGDGAQADAAVEGLDQTERREGKLTVRRAKPRNWNP